MKEEQKECNMYVLPPKITDEDISALFNGILNVVKKKIELDTRAEFLNVNRDMARLTEQLKAKSAECVRLKNEILRLKLKAGQSKANS